MLNLNMYRYIDLHDGLSHHSNEIAINKNGYHSVGESVIQSPVNIEASSHQLQKL